MKLLLDDDRVDVNQRDVANRTPLMQAVEFGSVLCVEHILASNKLINHIYEGTRIASDDIKALLDDYRARPREMKHRLRIKTGLNKVDAASVFIDIQLLCDGYLAFVPDIPNSVLRFFKLLLLFPVELQMLICNHLYQVKAQFISPTLICNGILKFVAKK
jgi:ankyrin repeat protein